MVKKERKVSPKTEKKVDFQGLSSKNVDPNLCIYLLLYRL